MTSPHGTRSRYVNGKCRCPDCTKAEREYHTPLNHIYREKKRAARALRYSFTLATVASIPVPDFPTDAPMSEGRCVGAPPGTFFPDRDDFIDVAAFVRHARDIARDYCRVCPAFDTCAAFAAKQSKEARLGSIWAGHLYHKGMKGESVDLLADDDDGDEAA